MSSFPPFLPQSFTFSLLLRDVFLISRGVSWIALAQKSEFSMSFDRFDLVFFFVFFDIDTDDETSADWWRVILSNFKIRKHVFSQLGSRQSR